MVSVISLCACYVAMRLNAVVFPACLLLLTSVDEPAVERAAVDNSIKRLDYDLLEFILLECCSISRKSLCLSTFERSRHSTTSCAQPRIA